MVHRLRASAALSGVPRRLVPVTTLPLSGEWVQNPGNNANGISSTPDGSALVVINSSNGTLYRVDPGSGEATAVDADAPADGR